MKFKEGDRVLHLFKLEFYDELAFGTVCALSDMSEAFPKVDVHWDTGKKYWMLASGMRLVTQEDLDQYTMEALAQ